MKGPGRAIVFGPHAVKFGCGADEDSLHHAVRVGIVCVEPVEAGEGGGPDGEDGGVKKVPAATGQYAEFGDVGRGVPIDLLAGEEMGGVEGSGVVVVVGAAHFALEFDGGSIGKSGELLARFAEQGNLGAGFRGEFRSRGKFNDKSLPVDGEQSGIDYTASEDGLTVIGNGEAWRVAGRTGGYERDAGKKKGGEGCGEGNLLRLDDIGKESQKRKRTGGQKKMGKWKLMKGRIA